MRRFIEGIDRKQATLFPECLEDWVDQDNPVRAIDTFVDGFDLCGVGFDGVALEATGRPSYHPSGLLKLYIYGYLNRVQSSRRLEREAGRNVEVMWLTCRLVPDHKTIADANSGISSPTSFSASCVQILAILRHVRRNSSWVALSAQRKHSRANDLHSSATGMIAPASSTSSLD